MSRLPEAWRAGTWALAVALVMAAPALAADAPGGPAAPPAQEASGLVFPAPMQQGMLMCPMMAGMSGGMGMMRMMGMNTSGMTMNHGTGAGTTLTDMAQNVTLRDLAQIVQELVAVQQRLLAALPKKPAADAGRDLARLKARSDELLGEIGAMVTAAARGE